ASTPISWISTTDVSYWTTIVSYSVAPLRSRGNTPMSKPAAGSGLSILIIEDNLDLATTLADYLRLIAGYQVFVATDGTTGIETAVRERPSVIICDIHLPTKSGIDVAAELSEVFAEMPLLVALTADSKLADQLFAAGYDKYFVKPVDPVELRTV